MSSVACIVLTTFASMKHADKVAKELVNLKLAACVQIGQPISSVYQWQDEQVSDMEIPMSIKTLPEKLDQAHKLVLSLHPYDVPQWLVLEDVSASSAYFNWMKSSLK